MPLEVRFGVTDGARNIDETGLSEINQDKIF